MKLRRMVTVKAIVTEDFKKNTINDIEKAIAKIENASQQLEFQARRYVPELAKTDINQAGKLRQEIESERNKHESAKVEFQNHRKMISELQLGEEFAQGEMEGIVDVEVGDDFSKKIAGAEIIIKDGVIQEIREA